MTAAKQAEKTGTIRSYFQNKDKNKRKPVHFDDDFDVDEDFYEDKSKFQTR